MESPLDSLTQIEEPSASEVAREKARQALNAARYVVKGAVSDMEEAYTLYSAVERLEVLATMQALDMLDAVKLR